MVGPELILRDSVAPPSPLPDAGELRDASDLRKQQAAKDFEAVLIDRLLSQMKNTIGDWGFERDGISKQVDGIFWSNLARGISDQGGFGLWKDIYKFLSKADAAGTTVESTG
jgi:Rod binding domain-containing protein